MKIGYIHDVRVPGPDASTVNVAKMHDAFAANGNQPLLVLPGVGERVDAAEHYGLRGALNSVAITLPHWLPARARLFAALAATVLRMRNVDLVYGRKPTLLTPAVRLGLPVVLELHSVLSPSATRARRCFEQLLQSPKLVRIVTISQALADDVAAEWPQAADRLKVAHDGADIVKSIAPAVPRPVPARPCVGYAGHLYPGKGMELIKELAALRPGVDFVIIGGRPEDISRWRADTASLTNIHFKGRVPHAQVAANLADCDAVLAPYSASVIVSDGCTDVARWMSPLKIFEYMAFGHAIMATDLPVIREILRDGETAILCPAGDVEAWALGLDGLLDDEQGRRALACAARDSLEREFTWDARADAVLENLSFPTGR